MNELFACPIHNDNKKRVSRALWIFTLLLFLLPLLLNTLAIIPLYTVLDADELTPAPLVVVIKYLQDFLDLFAFSTAYALVIFSTLLLSKRNTAFIVIFYTLAYLLQAPLKILMNAVIYGSIGSATQLKIDLIYLSVYFVLSMLQLLVIYAFAATDSNKYLASLASLKGSKNEKKRASAEKFATVLPFSKFIDWYNPLQRSAIKMSIFVTSIRVFARAVNDISYGAPESFGEVMIMVVYYLSELIYGAVAYLVALFVMNALYEVLKKKKDGDSSPSECNENIDTKL